MEDLEIFYPIKGYEGYYEINRLGIVRSAERVIFNDNTNIKRVFKSRLIKHSLSKFGYIRISLNFRSKSKKYFLHRLLAINFMPNPNNYPVINHIDCNKLNNNIENLEWCTISYNTKYNYDNGFINKGRKLSKEGVIDIFYNGILSLKGRGSNINYLSQKYKVNRGTIRDIIKGKTYKDITKDLTNSYCNMA